MKIQLNDNRYHHRSTLSDPSAKKNESSTLRNTRTATKIKEEMNYNINTTASKNTRGRTSFKGLNSEFVKEAERLSKIISEKKSAEAEEEVKYIITPRIIKYAKKLQESPKAQKALEWIGSNSVLGEALFALGITCALRPALIMLTPGNKEDKEKNKYAAAHSVASGIIGLVATLIVNTPLKNATKAIKKAEQFGGIIQKPSKETLQQVGEKAGELIRINRKQTLSVVPEVAQRVFNPIVYPLRASLTITLIPVILGFFGIKKADKNKQANSSINQSKMLMPEDNKKVFQSFTGVAKNENK